MNQEDSISFPEQPPISAIAGGADVETETDAEEPAESCRRRRLQPLGDAARSRAGEANSRFLYVIEQGAVLRKASGRVLVTKEETKLLEIPAVKLQGILLYGNVQITTQCIRSLLDEGIWVSFLSRTGSYKGRLQPPHERGGRLRQMQWHRSQDAAFCLGFGRAVVRGKMLGQKKVAAAYAKNYLAETLGDGHAVLRESLERLESVQSLDELRGIEGNASRAYFDLFRRWNRSELPFDGRHKRTAADPINALLNLGYTLLTRELEGLIESAGFDPAVGFYHLPDNDRPSLACDWVEEFRQVVVDRLVLKLINNQIIQPAHFEVHEDKGGVRIRPEGLRKFLDAYEKALTGPTEEAGNTPGFRSIFLNRLAAISDSVTRTESYQSHLEIGSVAQ